MTSRASPRRCTIRKIIRLLFAARKKEHMRIKLLERFYVVSCSKVYQFPADSPEAPTVIYLPIIISYTKHRNQHICKHVNSNCNYSTLNSPHGTYYRKIWRVLLELEALDFHRPMGPFHQPFLQYPPQSPRAGCRR